MRISVLQRIVPVALEKLNKLKGKYPELDAGVVISNGYGQVWMTSEPIHILDKAASLFAKSPVFTECSIIWRTVKSLELSNSDLQSPYIKKVIEALRSKVHLLLEELELDELSQVELRFGSLDYDLIAKLQRDRLVDQDLTLQSRGSIRIVLGNLRSLSLNESSSASVENSQEPSASGAARWPARPLKLHGASSRGL